jgi:hypothetical protein
MKALICALSVFCLACSNTPDIQYRDVPYIVEKVIYCAKDVSYVDYETTKIKKADSPERKVQALLIERQQRIIVETQLRTELAGCQKQDDIVNK